MAALVGAHACALARMVAAYSIRKDTPATERERLTKIEAKMGVVDGVLRELITRDAMAYEEMTAANAHAPAQRQSAALGALTIPMETAAACSRGLSLLVELVPLANRRLSSDLRIAAALADAAARSAGFTARANLADISDTPARCRFETELSKILEHCRALYESIETLPH